MSEEQNILAKNKKIICFILKIYLPLQPLLKKSRNLRNNFIPISFLFN